MLSTFWNKTSNSVTTLKSVLKIHVLVQWFSSYRKEIGISRGDSLVQTQTNGYSLINYFVEDGLNHRVYSWHLTNLYSLLVPAPRCKRFLIITFTHLLMDVNITVLQVTFLICWLTWDNCSQVLFSPGEAQCQTTSALQRHNHPVNGNNRTWRTGDIYRKLWSLNWFFFSFFSFNFMTLIPGFDSISSNNVCTVVSRPHRRRSVIDFR